MLLKTNLQVYQNAVIPRCCYTKMLLFQNIYYHPLGEMSEGQRGNPLGEMSGGQRGILFKKGIYKLYFIKDLQVF